MRRDPLSLNSLRTRGIDLTSSEPVEPLQKRNAPPFTIRSSPTQVRCRISTAPVIKEPDEIDLWKKKGGSFRSRKAQR